MEGQGRTEWFIDEWWRVRERFGEMKVQLRVKYLLF